MSESSLLPLVYIHLRYNRFYHDAELRSRHHDALEKACDAVRDIPATLERVVTFEKVYDDAMRESDPHNERS